MEPLGRLMEPLGRITAIAAIEDDEVILLEQRDTLGWMPVIIVAPVIAVMPVIAVGNAIAVQAATIGGSVNATLAQFVHVG